MANITREQLNKINSGAKNGYTMDLQYFLFHNEKTLEKYIDITGDDIHFLNITVDYTKYREGVTPTIRIAYNIKDRDFFTHSSGNFRKTFVLGDLTESRKNIKTLQQITEYLTPEFEKSIIAMYNSDDNKHGTEDMFAAFNRDKDIKITLEQLKAEFAKVA